MTSMRFLAGKASAFLLATLLLGMAGISSAPAEEDPYIVVQSTTSTEASGLFEYLLPKFEKMTGIDVRVVAVGTGQAIRNAKNGDGDVLFVHHTPSEFKFIAQGYGVRRFDVMYNDFILVGPKDDPAGVAGMEDVTKAMRKIAEAEAPFASRGDDSGTNKKELGLWAQTPAKPKQASGTWYRETGSGMGATLNTAVSMGAYTLSDRATWLNFKNKGSFEILVEGDPRLYNQYGVMLISPEKYPHVKDQMGQAFIDWLVSAEGQQAIAEYRLKGEQAFFPNAR
ncbi:substrate-binding domain-containing protein [Thiohalorhabdus sp. Cl-TMA]|uniref:Substrate-binding domain-containing protein n=1 Tax=Thiohalorhabdus methylotrophus TaxID=3242694 RepID=A0ABV4TYU0_9GAMM